MKLRYTAEARAQIEAINDHVTDHDISIADNEVVIMAVFHGAQNRAEE